MDKKYTIEPVFATPIYNTQIDCIDENVFEYIKGLPYQRMANGNGDISCNDYILDTPELSFLKQKIIDELFFYTQGILNIKCNATFYMTNSWVVKHHPGDFGASHFHGNSLISGVYYINTNENTGRIVFEKTSNYPNLFSPVVDIEFDIWNIFNSSKWAHQPKNGQLFLFPSITYHSIEKNNSNEIRYSLAFNFFVRGVFGKHSSILELK